MTAFYPLYGWLIVVAWVVVSLFVGAAIVQWLWNITMPEAFGVNRIRYWIAFRLLLLATILTSGGFVQYRGH